ncbi:HEAT repeat domain-containing protein [Neorhodopirellula pilleata]|uniref:HEAT repeat protein n=1 Tax=Neorhodopirellula pilleata TaxID=2714738 RepID=A0A5C6ADU4_9BACT|nr:HEAT repeat domain-containing protein [Neorhodopirellula pilleata]TWT97355.1 HEAT repeat protein [Neorhodopirellula pilleata]
MVINHPLVFSFMLIPLLTLSGAGHTDELAADVPSQIVALHNSDYQAIQATLSPLVSGLRIQDILQLSTHSNPEMRAFFLMNLLDKLPPESAQVAITRLMEDTDEKVSRHAIEQRLRSIGIRNRYGEPTESDRDALSRLDARDIRLMINQMGRDGALDYAPSCRGLVPSVNSNISWALSHVGGPLVDMVTDAASHNEAAVRARIAIVLGNRIVMDGTTIRALIKGLEDRDISVRISSATALGNAKQETRQVSAALIRHRSLNATSSEHKQLRTAIIDSLGKLSSPNCCNVRYLVEALEDEDFPSRRLISTHLGRLAKTDPYVTSVLIELLSSDKPWVVECALSSLKTVGTEAASAVPKLKQMLQKELSPVIARTLWAIENNAGSVLPCYSAILKSGNQTSEVIQIEALTGLKEMGPSAGSAVSDIVELLDADRRVARIAISVLRAIGPEAKAAVPSLQNIVDTKKESLHSLAKYALTKIKG